MARLTGVCARDRSLWYRASKAMRDLQDLALLVQRITPTTMNGVLIQAHILTAYDRAAKDAHADDCHVGLIGGRELAEALLRLAPEEHV